MGQTQGEKKPVIGQHTSNENNKFITVSKRQR